MRNSGLYGRKEEPVLNTWPFRPLNPDDMPRLIRCRDMQAHPFTALSPVSLISWADTYGFSIAGDDDFFVIHSRYDRGYYAPVGDPEKCAAFMEYAAKREQPVRFLYLTEPEAKALAEKGWKVFFRADLSEYILSSARMALEPNTYSHKSFRNKCNRFARTYGQYQVSPVTEENLDRVREVADRYLEAQSSLPSDQAVMNAELEYFSALCLRGILLTVPDGREAFILGYENTPGMFTLTMTRHDPTLSEETTTICVHEFASVLQRQYPLLNVEEDMGLDGLRRAKTLLSPVDILKVYEVQS